MADVLQRGLLTLISWTDRRNTQIYSSDPWCIVPCLDDRVPLHLRKELAKQWWESSAEKLSHYFGKRLRGMLKDSLDLFKPRVRRFLIEWARSVRLTNAVVEFAHGKHGRLLNDTSIKWPRFAALAINDEFRSV
jgi:hypothetical protein